MIRRGTDYVTHTMIGFAMSAARVATGNRDLREEARVHLGLGYKMTPP